MGAFMLVLKNWLFRAVNNNGAVSPLCYGPASNRPVVTTACGTAMSPWWTLSSGVHRVQKAASRTAGIKAERMFSVVRNHHVAISESAILPAQPESAHCGWPSHRRKAPAMRRRQHDVGHKTRQFKRSCSQSPYSARYTPPGTPAGVDTGTVNPTIIRLPTMALASPPPSDPGAGVEVGERVQSSAAKPFVSNTLQSEQHKQPQAMDPRKRQAHGIGAAVFDKSWDCRSMSVSYRPFGPFRQA